MTGMTMVRLLVSGLLVWLANGIFPNQVVLGTACISKMWAVIYSATALTMINIVLLPLTKRMKDNTVASAFVINVAGVWLVGRLAKNLGMGIGSWWVAVALGLVLTAVQKVVAQKVTGLVKK